MEGPALYFLMLPFLLLDLERTNIVANTKRLEIFDTVNMKAQANPLPEEALILKTRPPTGPVPTASCYAWLLISFSNEFEKLIAKWVGRLQRQNLRSRDDDEESFLL